MVETGEGKLQEEWIAVARTLGGAGHENAAEVMDALQKILYHDARPPDQTASRSVWRALLTL